MEIIRLNEKKEASEELKELFLKKFQIIRSSTTRRLGAANLQRSAEYLFEIIFHPASVDKIIKDLDITDSEKFPHDVENLKKSFSEIGIEIGQIPQKEEFTKAIIRAMSRSEYENCLFEGSLGQLDKLSESGPIIIWTAGDVFGPRDSNIPGSFEQPKKVTRAGLAKWRNKKFKEKRALVKDKKEILELCAFDGNNRKEEYISEICSKLIERGAKSIVIVEDVLKNLEKATEQAIEVCGISVFPIHVKQGHYRDMKTKRGFGYDVINDVGELSGKLDTISALEKPVGFILDFDGVIMDHEKRQRVENDSALSAILENNWLNIKK